MTEAEQQYIDRLNEFNILVEDVANRSDGLNSGDTEAAKQMLNDMKAPFIQFAGVQAPARFAQAHERYKNGCAAMVQYIDICIQFMDDPNPSSAKVSEFEENTRSAFEKLTEEFLVGDSLFFAAV
ncbi:hypothetical protein [Enterocloster asparagiformis]|uniref:hypothetical protein n=1 Tax=Enterocloster asparagiformis TaxID=333367 RepID=UPI0004661437|nr:hypothetical protein [Enterocloster asparagiformis]